MIKDLVSSVNLNKIARSQKPTRQYQINTVSSAIILSHGAQIFTTQMKQNSFLLYHFGQNKNTFDTQIPFGLSSAATKGKNLIKSDWAFHKSILD